jgi:hypothetical protein
VLAGYAKADAKIGGQKIQVGLSCARKTVEVIVEADTRALRHIQRRRAFELVSAKQHHSEFLAQLAPGGAARLTPAGCRLWVSQPALSSGAMRVIAIAGL